MEVSKCSRSLPAASLPACDNGRGVVRYERIPDTVIDGNPIQEDVVSVCKGVSGIQVSIQELPCVSQLAFCSLVIFLCFYLLFRCDSRLLPPPPC